MSNPKGGVSTQKTKTTSSPFPILLIFFKGDKRCDINGFRYIGSIQTKIDLAEILLQEFLEQIPEYKKEMEKLKKLGHADILQNFKLVAKYETYLNNIYSLMENLSYIVRRIYHKHSLPWGFNKQVNRFLKDETIDPKYTKILANIPWYKEARKIRSESTHFLSGIIVSYNEGIPGYFNMPQSERYSKVKKIEVRDIVKHAKLIHESLMIFIEKFGKHFLWLIDKNERIVIPCVIVNGRIGARMISCNEYLSNKPGICHTPDVKCPKAKDCLARKNIGKYK